MGRPKQDTKRKAISEIDDELIGKRSRTRSGSVVSNGSNDETQETGSEVTFKISKSKTEKTKLKKGTPNKSPLVAKGKKVNFGNNNNAQVDNSKELLHVDTPRGKVLSKQSKRKIVEDLRDEDAFDNGVITRVDTSEFGRDSSSDEDLDSEESEDETEIDDKQNDVVHTDGGGAVSTVSKDTTLSKIDELINRRMEEEKEALRAEYRAEFKKLEKLKNEIEQEKGKWANNNGKDAYVNEKSVNKTPVQVQSRGTNSDTTIYAPALAKSPPNDRDCMMDKIANFVEEMRSQHSTDVREVRQRTPPRDEDPMPSTSRDEAEHSSKDIADQIIIDAEQYKAHIEKPTGTLEFNGNGLSDDDFFHLICHVEPSMRAKIEKGQYVDLEKLLPNDRLRKNDQATRLGWWHKEGDTFLAPINKDQRINSAKRWDAAFRVYATIYCRANPDRAGEIWQYIDIIHTASSAYVWDNVAKYDQIFRQLMEFNPRRSWAVTYNLMWNLSMVEPLPKMPNFRSGDKNFQKRQSNANSEERPKYNHCWSFQKGENKEASRLYAELSSVVLIFVCVLVWEIFWFLYCNSYLFIFSCYLVYN